MYSLDSDDNFDDDLDEVVEMLSGITAEWPTIARKLRLKSGNMATIQTNHSKDAKMCLQLAVTEWLKLKYNMKRS